MNTLIQRNPNGTYTVCGVLVCLTHDEAVAALTSDDAPLGGLTQKAATLSRYQYGVSVGGCYAELILNDLEAQHDDASQAERIAA